MRQAGGAGGASDRASGAQPAAFATIDIGTNTTLLLIARERAKTGGPIGADATAAGGLISPTHAEPIEILAERAEVTRLGRGIGVDGGLGQAGIERTLGVLREYAALARQHGARIAAIGTEALRRAPNAGDFLDPAGAILGTAIEVIDGEREAMLTFAAVAAAFPRELARGRAVVVDIGGGSTEVIVTNAGAIAFRHSFPIGSVRLTERHVRHDPPEAAELAALEADIAATLATEPTLGALAAGDGGEKPGGDEPLLVGVAGTVTSLAAMAQNLASYDPTLVHGFVLTSAELDTQIGRLAASTQVERERMPGLDPRRADVLLAGAVILRALLRLVRARTVRVSDRGIRWGLFHELCSATPSDIVRRPT